MSDDRQTQAAAEAERRWPRKQSPGDPYPASRYRRMSMDRRIGFMQGVEWADAHPHVTPEELVRAYEDGQRDAVEKGLARSWITRTQLRMIVEAGRHWRDSDFVRLKSLAGVEVRDE